MKIKNVKIEINKKLVIVVIALIIVALVLGLVNAFVKNRYTASKIDSKREYVIIRYNNKQSSSFVPYINLNSNDAKDVNNEIKSITSSYLSSDTKDTNVTYRFNAYKNTLSVVLMFKDYDGETYNYSFKTYVFNLENGKLLTDDEILKMFNSNYNEISIKIENEMKIKYADEVERGIITNCDYNTCYLDLRGIKSYIEGANLYTENGKLVVYKAYNVYSKYKEEEYFTRNDFKFIIK